MEGGCLCGQVRYRLLSDPVATALCHCTHCQKSSGAAFSVNLIMRSEQVETYGSLARYADRGESGAPVERCFCAKCGSVLMSVLAPVTGLTAVKAGSLDDSSSVKPTAEYWTRSAQHWMPPTGVATSYNTDRS